MPSATHRSPSAPIPSRCARTRRAVVSSSDAKSRPNNSAAPLTATLPFWGRLLCQPLSPSDRWHLDEMVVRIAGKRMYLWRAVDHEGEVLDMLVQRRRDKRAALRLMRKLLKKQGFTPKLLTTDKLGSYGSAFRHLRLTCPQRAGTAEEQSRGKLPSSGATTRAQDATVQISSIRAALPQYPCRRPQHIQFATTPRLTVHAADLPSRSGGAVARCRRSSINLICLAPLGSSIVAVTRPARRPGRPAAGALAADRALRHVSPPC